MGPSPSRVESRCKKGEVVIGRKLLQFEVARQADAIKQLFHETSSKFDVDSVQQLNNWDLERLFFQTALSMDQQFESPYFLPEAINDPGKLSLLHLLQHSCRTDLISMEANHLKFVLCWHGVTSDDAVQSIARTGLANLRQLDAGFYGSGRYCSLEAAYACKYSSTYPRDVPKNSRGCWSVLLCIGVVGNVYPITSCADDYCGQLPPSHAEEGVFFGSPLKTKYDTHFIGVKGPSYLPPALPSGADYHELVFEAVGQVLPVAVVQFREAFAQQAA